MVSLRIRLLVAAVTAAALSSPMTAQPRALELRQIPPLQIPQNSHATRLVDLWDYVSAPDLSPPELRFSLVAPLRFPNAGGANLTLEENRYLVAEPSPNWTGEEIWAIEVSDGQRVDYVRVPVTVASSQAGELIEVESSSRIVLAGEWRRSYHQGADFLVTNKPGDRLELEVDGSYLVARVWTGVMLETSRYFEGRYDDNRYAFLSDWKAYHQGSAQVLVDGVPTTTLQLSTAQSGGWSEMLLATDVKPGRHRLTIVVDEGYVSIDRIRVSSSPLHEVEVDVSDPLGTPLSDVLVTFSRPDRPDIVLRTDHRGRSGSFYGLPPGNYDVTVAPDSNPGYLRGDAVEEHIAPFHRAGVTIDGRLLQQSLHFDLAYDKPDLRSVSLIERPRGTVPFLARPGDTLVVHCRYDEPLSNLRVTLSNQLHARPLQVLGQQVIHDNSESAAVPGLRITARIPADAPAGLWDLSLHATEVEDVANRAVAIRAGERSAYRFVQISDLHIRDSATNREHAEQLLDIMDEIELFDPSFVVMTGDLTDSGSRPEYLRLLVTLDGFAVPTYAVPGNHDHYSWWTRYLYRGGEEYRRFLGPGYYAFTYGFDRYIVVDTGAYERIHDRRLPGAYEDQWSWLQQQLAFPADAPGMTTVLAHYDYTSTLPRQFSVSNQLIDLLQSAHVDNYVHGHLHRSFETAGHPRIIATGSTIKGELRLFDVKDSRIVKTTVLKAGDLELHRNDESAGPARSCEAEVTNSTSNTFAGLTLHCLLSPSADDYRIEGGRIASVDSADDGSRALLIISFDLPGNSSRLVRASTAVASGAADATPPIGRSRQWVSGSYLPAPLDAQPSPPTTASAYAEAATSSKSPK